jgi:hypothetical protein
MIRTVNDVYWITGESNAARIARWTKNAWAEIDDATPEEIETIKAVSDTIRKRPETYAWGEKLLLDMGLRWMLWVVEPDRSHAALQRLGELRTQR